MPGSFFFAEPMLLQLRSLANEGSPHMHLFETPLTFDQRQVVGVAYDEACKELELGNGSLDVAKRERVAELIVAFVLRGEMDVDVLHRRAVIHCRNTDEHPNLASAEA